MGRGALVLLLLAAGWMAGDHPMSAQQAAADDCPIKYRRDTPEADRVREAKKAELRARGMPERFLHLLDKERCVACIERASDSFHIQVEYNDDENAPVSRAGGRVSSHGFKWDPQSERQVRELLAAGKIRKFYIYNTARRCQCCPEVGIDTFTAESYTDWDPDDEVNKDQTIEYDDPGDLGPLPEDLTNPPPDWINDVPNIQQFSKPPRRVLQATCQACEGLAAQWNKLENDRNALWDQKLTQQERISIIENAVGNRQNEIARLEYQQMFPSTASPAGQQQIEQLQQVNADQLSDRDRAERELARIDGEIAAVDAEMAAVMKRFLECEAECRKTLTANVQPAAAPAAADTPTASAAASSAPSVTAPSHSGTANETVTTTASNTTPMKTTASTTTGGTTGERPRTEAEARAADYEESLQRMPGRIDPKVAAYLAQIFGGLNVGSTTVPDASSKPGDSSSNVPLPVKPASTNTCSSIEECAQTWRSCIETNTCAPLEQECVFSGTCSNDVSNPLSRPATSNFNLMNSPAWETSADAEVERRIQIKIGDWIFDVVIREVRSGSIGSWFNPLGLLTRRLRENLERWQGSVGPRPLPTRRDLELIETYSGSQAAGLPKGVHVLLTDRGGSTGKTLAMQVLNLSGQQVRLSSLPFVIEPLKQQVQQRVQQAFTRLVKAAPVTVDLAGYCLEFTKLPPAANQIYRLAPAAVQRQFEPMSRVLRSAFRVQQAGALRPDSSPAAYADSIKQWAIWAVEQNFNERRFTEAFLGHTKKNVEAAGQPWSKPAEEMVRKVASNRWRDIARVLQGAGLPVPQ